MSRYNFAGESFKLSYTSMIFRKYKCVKAFGFLINPSRISNSVTGKWQSFVVTELSHHGWNLDLWMVLSCNRMTTGYSLVHLQRGRTLFNLTWPLDDPRTSDNSRKTMAPDDPCLTPDANIYFMS